MTLPIKIQYKWSIDELIDGFKAHVRCSSWATKFVTPFIPFVGGFMVFGFLFVTLSGKQSFLSSVPLAVLGIFLLFSNRIIYWQLRRNFTKNPNKDAQVTWIFTEATIHSEGKGFDSNLSWEKVFLFVDAQKGFLIYPQRGIFYWIPFSSFAEESEMDCVRQLAKSKVISYRKVG